MPVAFNIFGSCCSREIMNYSKQYQVNAYVQQNPIHTLKASPLIIEEADAVSALNSNFIKRMIVANFNKNAMDLLMAQESEYLMIDFADCRFGYYQFTEPANVRVAATWNATLTLEKLKAKRNLKYTLVNPSDISDSEWETYIDDFLTAITARYSEDRIVINEITFAEKYVEGREIKEFNKEGIELSARSLVEKIESKVEDRLPGARILKRIPNAFGNIYHPYGNIPLHYADYVYKYMIKQLDYVMGVTPLNIYG